MIRQIYLATVSSINSRLLSRSPHTPQHRITQILHDQRYHHKAPGDRFRHDDSTVAERLDQKIYKQNLPNALTLLEITGVI